MHAQFVQQVVGGEWFDSRTAVELLLGQAAQNRGIRFLVVRWIHDVSFASALAVATITMRINSVFPSAVTIRRALSTMRCGPMPGKLCSTT